ncbi:MAG: sn-glycerol-3-phosphate transporter ATP-binding protein UgpC, partial [Pseudomonadota bacterium]
MAQLELRKVQKSFGSSTVIHGVDLTVKEGEFCVFVGPSGCGKSTLLRMIAGLEECSGGHVLMDNVDVTHEQPARRGIAMVFQSYALYPHMTVAENMGFGLKIAKEHKTAIATKVNMAAKTLQIEHLLERRPRDLSGGQRQRVAIGRAIVRAPKMFLFDEPLSNLDAALRVEMRIELAKIKSELNTTVIYVTHDQIEAMTLAD